MALTIFGIWELAETAYDDILNPANDGCSDGHFDVDVT